jgi:hypothetical protein
MQYPVKGKRKALWRGRQNLLQKHELPFVILSEFAQ